MVELEDLESMRRRIREGARAKREHELQRRRKKAASRRRKRLREEGGDDDDGDDNNNESSSSSSSSADLLASSPSPSPSPTELDDVDNEDNTSPVKTNSLVGGSSTAMRCPTTSTSRGTSTREMQSSSTFCSSSAVAVATATTRTNSKIEPKNSGYDSELSSDSDVGMEQLAKRIMERKQAVMMGRGNIFNSKNRETIENSKCTIQDSASNNGDNRSAKILRIPWSDDSSEEDTEQLPTAPVVEKRMSDSCDAIPTLHLGNEMSSRSREKEESEAITRAMNCSAEISTSNANGVKRAVNESKETELHQLFAVEQYKIHSPQNMRQNTKSDRETHIAVNRTDNNQLLDALRDSTKSAATLTTKSPKTDQVKCAINSAPDKKMDTDPIIGSDVRHKQSNVTWSTHKQCLLIRSVVSSYSPRNKVAGFDLDQTLVNWRCAGWPSKSEHYELWNSTVIDTLRKLHDDEGYTLVIFSNQGGIKNALGGKKAGTVKGIIDWIADIVARPIFAIVSTKIHSGYHKPNPSMWEVFEEVCNYGKEASPEKSFFVGDADGSGDDKANLQQQQHQKTGTDKLFAEQVGELRNTTMKFHTPSTFFGPSNIDRRRSCTAAPTLPPEAIRARAALLGGYLKGQICLILVGVQGSGKTTFCQSLVNGAGGDRWAHFSQDTINNGRPGTRQAVEEAAQNSIQSGKNVVIDRMHLDAEQRQYFIQLGRKCQVRVHCLVITATKEEVESRVKNRINHPGKVEGEYGARIAMASISRLVAPQYEEGFELISYLWKMDDRLLHSYRVVGDFTVLPTAKAITLCNGGAEFSLPMITFGTMNLKTSEAGSLVSQALQIGVASVDTAPTYGNEREVGVALNSVAHVIVTIKIPKRAIYAKQARDEVVQSLCIMQRSRVDIILLHWPCDFIEAGTLTSVWKELEAMKNEDLCSTIGVCNFTVWALKILLSDCTIKPSLNQVERHPLLPQFDLLDFCNSQGIAVQAHTALGNGSEVLLGNSTIVRIARENELTPGQVLILWNLQQQIPVVARFSSEKHGRELVALQQGEIRVLSPHQMQAIDDLGTLDSRHRFVSPPFMFRRGAAYSWG